MWCKKLLFSIVVVASGVILPLTAHAERIYSSEQTITVTATVLEHRTIVVDANGVITHISSNTTNDVEPRVYFLSFGGMVVPMSADVAKQYTKLMSQLGSTRIFTMDRQEPVIDGLLPSSLFPMAASSYWVRPSEANNQYDPAFAISQ